GSVIAVGLQYWPIPYNGLSLPNAVWGTPLIAVAVFGVVARVTAGIGFWRTLLVFSGAVPAAVMARVVFEGILDPTSHNLWPFEIALASGPGLVAGSAAAIIGTLLAFLGLGAKGSEAGQDSD